MSQQYTSTNGPGTTIFKWNLLIYILNYNKKFNIKIKILYIKLHVLINKHQKDLNPILN